MDGFNGNVRVPLAVQELVMMSDLFRGKSGLRKGASQLRQVWGYQAGVGHGRFAVRLDALDRLSTSYHEITQ
jgi:hypothetical protein